MMKKYKKIYIEITNVCNLNCSFCSRTKKAKKAMTSDEFEIVLKKIDNYTDYIYLHVQGEPLLHPKLEQILKLCDKYQKKVNIVTNGTLIGRVKDILVNSKSLRQIVFSLHSYKGQALSKYLNPIFEVSEELLDNGVIVSYRFWNEDLENQNDELLKKIKEFYELKEITCQKIKNNLYLNRGTSFVWPSLDLDYYCETGNCYGTRSHIAILSDGTVIPCCLDKDGIIELGNIFSDSIEDIINSEKYQRIQKGFLQRKKEEELCKHCSFIK